MRFILWQCILEKCGGTSYYFEDLDQWDLNVLILKFNLQHKSEIWMFLKVCKGWLFSSTAGFVTESTVPLPWSICAPYHPVTSCCQLSVYFLLFFFLTGIPLSNFSSLVLVSSNPAVSLIFKLCIAVPITLLVLFQKPVFSCQVLLFLPHILLTLLPHHSHILSFLPARSFSYILCSHPVLPKYQTYSVSFILSCFKSTLYRPKPIKNKPSSIRKTWSCCGVALNKPVWKLCCYIRLFLFLNKFLSILVTGKKKACKC